MTTSLCKAVTNWTRSVKKPNQTNSRGFPDDGVIRVSRERRRASSVTMIHGLASHELDAIGALLRKLCGTGGTAKAGVVELQGDHRDRVVAWFEEQKRKVKRAGG
jgi:translation initiation factor 1